MAAYTMYHLKTGEVISTIDVPDEHHLLLNTPKGCASIEGRYDPRCYIIRNRKAVKFKPKIDAEAMRAAALRLVDQLAATEAAGVLDPIYRTKYDLAMRASPDLSVEAEARGMTLKQLADLVIAKHHESQAAVAKIDAVRLAKKAALAQATTPDEIAAIAPDIATNPDFAPR